MQTTCLKKLTVHTPRVMFKPQSNGHFVYEDNNEELYVEFQEEEDQYGVFHENGEVELLETFSDEDAAYDYLQKEISRIELDRIMDSYAD